jgi:hypothetical protein
MYDNKLEKSSNYWNGCGDFVNNFTDMDKVIKEGQVKFKVPTVTWQQKLIDWVYKKI